MRLRGELSGLGLLALILSWIFAPGTRVRSNILVPPPLLSPPLSLEAEEGFSL